MPLGVTGNTSASGAEESWFDPRRGNSSTRIGLAPVRVFRIEVEVGRLPSALHHVAQTGTMTFRGSRLARHIGSHGFRETGLVIRERGG
jgi:hypothetical protein